MQEGMNVQVREALSWAIDNFDQITEGCILEPRHSMTGNQFRRFYICFSLSSESILMAKSRFFHDYPESTKDVHDFLFEFWKECHIVILAD